MLTLEPELAILDETDSGLDIDALQTIAEGVNNIILLFKKGKNMDLTFNNIKMIE